MNIKRLILLILFSALLLLSGCGAQGDSAETESSALPESTVAAEPELSDAIHLSEGGQALHTVIYSFSANDKLYFMAEQVASHLSDSYGITLTVASDTRKKADSTIPEILIGETNRPEVEGVTDELGYNGYIVRAVDNKIMICGNTDEAQQAAMEAFFGALRRSANGDVLLCLPEGGIMEAGENGFFAGGNAADYVIVTDEESKDAAETLQAEIAKKYGYTLPLRASTEPETAREILVGTCGRASAEAALNEISSFVGTVVKTEGEKIMLLGKSSLGTLQAVDYFCENYMSNPFSRLWHIPREINFSYGGLFDADYTELTEGADIRIMSFNIMAEHWNDNIPVEGRDAIVAATLFTYLPDVVGMQEVTEKWYERLIPMVEKQYAFINPTVDDGDANYVGMAYNPDRLNLIEYDYEPFSVGENKDWRLMNWGIFETRENGKRFVVINIHFSSKDKYQDLRMIQGNELSEKIHFLKETYKCPVIVMGDFNCNATSPEYKQYIEQSNTLDAQWDSVKKVNNNYKTFHQVGSKAGSGETAIDHITYTAGAESLFYYNINAESIVNASDHNPIMADFKLN